MIKIADNNDYQKEIHPKPRGQSKRSEVESVKEVDKSTLRIMPKLIPQ